MSVLTGLMALAGALGANGLIYSVSVDDDRLVVEAIGERFSVPVEGPTTPLHVTLFPQERFSTPQVLVVDRGLIVNGLLSLPAVIGLGRDPSVHEHSTAARRSYFHFNPFRASLVARSGSNELRLEVNIPDGSIEAWQEQTKIASCKISPSWVRLIGAPLLAAVAAAWLLARAVAGRRHQARGRAGDEASAAASPPRPTTARCWEAFLAAVVGGAVTAVLLWTTADAMPGFGDEMNYLMQGRIFASGRAWMPEPATPEFFRVGWMDMFWEDGRVWGFHPPGNSLHLALGWLVGCYWITVPVVGGALLAAQYLLALQVFGGRRAALLHLALFATSHYVLSLAASFMAHATSMLCLSLLYLFGIRFLARGRTRDLLLAAVASGAAFNVRPLSAILATVPLAVVMVVLHRRRGWRAFTAAALLGLGVALLTPTYTWLCAGRFTLPYAVKGPEASRTLVSRVARPFDEHLANLYRNCNELQHRAHSGGIVGNAALFFVPLFLWRRHRARRWLALAAGAFVFFVVSHSVLHWYGWKWEPRMMYDAVFLAFLVATAGLETLLSAAGAGSRKRQVVWIALALGVAAIVLVDLPRRFSTEYLGYNHAPTGVMSALRRGELENAVVFFGSEVRFACYTPFNTPSFDGNPLFARHQGDLLDYRLLARFPDRRVFFTPDGETLHPRDNLYRRDLEALAAALERDRQADPLVVVPWLRVAPSPLLDVLPGDLVDPEELLDRLLNPRDPAAVKRLVVLVAGAAELATTLDRLFETDTPAGPRFETRVEMRVVGDRRPVSAELLPGLLMTCHEGVDWSGSVLARSVVTTPSIDLCAGEDRSITWQALVDLPARRKAQFTLESDDGSAILVDGRMVLDNNLESTHGVETRSAEVILEPGRHELVVKYFNGPGDAVLRVTVALDDELPRSLSVDAFGPEGALFLPPTPVTGQGTGP